VACLDEPTVVAFVAGRISGEAVDAIDDHLADCRACRDLVVVVAKTTLAIGSTVPSSSERAPASPGSAGARSDAQRREESIEPPKGERYAITSLIGVGAQGLVYAADDAVLGRPVALKLLRAGEDRILREARLIARLNHPNIVAIYDAGTTGDGAIYLAMEYVAGGTLDAWREHASPRDILAACIGAARGVAAAHAAGIIHRDVKPTNILIGADGRARVTDFGLAVEGASERRELVGTIAYMAPEQLAGGVATVASDQFGLAVAIWEALAGASPFAGVTPAQRRDAIAAGPRAAKLPRHVASALRRALSPDPAKRWPDVTAFADALAVDPRRRRIVAGSIAATAVALGIAGYAVLDRTGPTCDVGNELAGVWNDAARGRVPPIAVHALDDYARAWLASRTRACDEPGELLALHTQCLADRKTALAAAIRVLGEADRDVANHALDIATQLPAIAPCDDHAWLAQRVRPPTDPAGVARVSAIEGVIAEASATLRAGKIKQAIQIAQRAVDESESVDHAPTRAHAAFVLGQAQAHLPDNVAAEANLERAAQWAQRGRDDRAAAEAWIELVNVIGHGFARFDEALRHAQFADATLARIGDDPALRATLDYYRCAVYDLAAKFADANAACAAARKARETAFGPDDVAVADVAILQARLATNQSRYADAVQLAERALHIREKVLGRDHPAVCETLFSLGQVQMRVGKLADAEAGFRRGLAIAVPVFGERSAVVASFYAELASLELLRSDLPAALADIDRSTAIRETADNKVDLVFNLTQRGRILEGLGRLREAAESDTRALALAEKVYGGPHPNLAALLQDLGRLHGRLGDPARARTELDRAVAIGNQLGDRETIAASEAALAEFLHGGGKPRDALPHYERAMAIYEQLLGASSPQLIPTLGNVALAHVDLHEPALALPLLARAIALEEARSGKSSAGLLEPLTTLGEAQRALGRTADARATWQRALGLSKVAEQFPTEVRDLEKKLALIRP
jgi:tetratricopeptide (TPR) repeat protein